MSNKATNTTEYLERELNRAMQTIEAQADEIDRLERRMKALRVEAQVPESREIDNAWAPWLTRHETYLLAALAQHGRIMSRGMLQEILQGYGNSRSLDPKTNIAVRLSQIRKKATRLGVNVGIVTHRGYGFQIREDRLTAVRALLWARYSDIKEIRDHHDANNDTHQQIAEAAAPASRTRGAGAPIADQPAPLHAAPKRRGVHRDHRAHGVQPG